MGYRIPKWKIHCGHSDSVPRRFVKKVPNVMVPTHRGDDYIELMEQENALSALGAWTVILSYWGEKSINARADGKVRNRKGNPATSQEIAKARFVHNIIELEDGLKKLIDIGWLAVWDGDQATIVDEKFAKFWDSYPRREGLKSGKKAAKKAWDKIKPDEKLAATIMSSLARHQQMPGWQRDNGRYIPMASTWLNAAGWESELETPEESLLGQLPASNLTDDELRKMGDV